MIAIMPSRLQEFQEAVAGYSQTHVDLVAKGTHGLQAAAIGNDVGPFYFIIRMVDAFHISLETAITLFLGSLLLLGLISGLIGITLLWRKSRYYWWSVASLLILTALTYKIGDVYVASTAVAVGTAPHILLVLRRKSVGLSQLAGFLVIGLSLGLANSVRAQAGTTMLLFALVGLLVATTLAWKHRLQLMAALVIGMLIPSLFFTYLISQRDDYLTKNAQGYTEVITAHPFWHSTYIGFGYLNNDLGIKYVDENGMQKVASIDSSAAYLSSAYEGILRQQTFDIIKTHPLFALTTLFSKLGIIVLLYLPFFANLGLWKAFRERMGGKDYFPFYLALAFSSLNGILAVPDLRYLTGFAALAVLYGLTALNSKQHA